MYIYTKYYQLFGIRNLRQLSAPPMAMVNRLYLPLSSIYHCTDIDETAVGVLPNDDILSHVNSRESPIFVEHVSSLAPIAQHGHPTELSMSFNTDITEYHRGFKQLRRFNNPNLLNNQKALLVYSYNLIPRHYRYSPQPLTQYHQWANLFLTVIATINRSSVNNNRQHFIQIDMPPRVPPLSHLEAAATTKDRPYMTRFNTDSLRVIADIFAWVSEHTASSLLATLDTRYADRVNFIFMHGGHFTTLNLGMLTKWRVGADGKRGPDVLDPAQLKRRYLSFLMSVSQVSTVVDTLPDVDTMDAVEPTNEIDSKRADIDAEFEDGSAISNDLDVRIKERLETQTTGSLADAIARTAATADNNSVDDIIDASADIVNEKQLDADLAELEVMATNDEASAAQATFYKPYVAPTNTPEAGVQRAADALARQGKLSAAEHRRLVQLSTRYKQLPNPYNTKETLEQLATITPESLKIDERTPIATAIPGVVDSSMLSSSLSVMDSKYIREVMHKDIAGAVLHMQQMGFVVQGYQVQQVDDFTDSYEVLTVNVIPATGKASTLSIKLPRVNENGGFLASGVKCRMRRQRGDVPIRKTKPNEVALTSYISKLFVTRSDLSTFNYDKWLTNEVIKMSLLGDGTKLTNIRMSDVFNGDAKLPYIYTILARKISGFNYGIYKFSFDWTNRIEFFGLEMSAVLDKHKDEDRLLTAIAYAPDSVLLLDRAGDIHEISTRTDAPAVNHGSFESFLGIDTAKRPHDIAEVGIFGKQIPLGIALGFHVGLGNLMATLKTVYRRVPKGSHHSISDREFALRFADETLIIERNGLNELILGGFNRYAKDIKRYSVYLFDKPEVYANVLDSNQLGVRWIREFVLLFRSWVDHITRDLLIEMREPTDLFLLFIRAAELLMTDQAPHQMDMRYMRDKGYERFAGMVYFEIAKAMRGYLSKPATANAALDLNPKAVWLGLLQDQSVMPTDESNPIHSLKEQEEIIYSGAGGRTARTMTEQARVFHPTVKGVVSEATKDSGDAATVIYTSADPNYTSLRGTTRQLTEDKGNASKIVSTSFLMAAGVQNDDPKRANFVNIQNSQTTHCVGYTPSPVRTGYERVLAHRTNELYAKTARMAGKVTSVTANVITVAYDDGEIVTYEIGRRFGTWAGHTLPHDIRTDLKVGDTVGPNDPIVYNSQYFVRDTLDPKQIIYKQGVLARVVLWESPDTLEDSSAISPELSKLLTTQQTEIRYIKVPFDNEIRNLIKVGTVLTPDDILCRLHPRTAGNADLFDEDSMALLDTLSSSAPRAKLTGIVDKIEVLYAGELDDMSATLRLLVERSDSDIRKFNKQMGRRAVDGYVAPMFRVGGTPLETNTAMIKLYITTDNGTGVGDKLVYANQLKSVIGRVLYGVNKSKDGQGIDAIFGYLSIQNRVVLSPELTGTTSTLLVALGERFVAAYEKG